MAIIFNVPLNHRINSKSISKDDGATMNEQLPIQTVRALRATPVNSTMGPTHIFSHVENESLEILEQSQLNGTSFEATQISRGTRTWL